MNEPEVGGGRNRLQTATSQFWSIPCSGPNMNKEEAKQDAQNIKLGKILSARAKLLLANKYIKMLLYRMKTGNPIDFHIDIITKVEREAIMDALRDVFPKSADET